MEKSMKTKHGVSQLCSSLERSHTCSPITRIKSPASLKTSELNLIKAQNHIIKGKIIDNPSTIQQMCNILGAIDTNKFEFGPKPFHVNSFTNMQKRQSQKLLIWLKSKLSQLKRTSQVTIQDYVQYKQSIVNIGLASVMSMIGTICKQLAETLGCLWSQTFNMLQKIIDSSIKRQSQKDKLIMTQQIQLQKQKSLFVQSVIRIQEQQTYNLKTLKQNFKDCIITNRQLNKQVYRLNDDLRGEHIKLQNIEYALIRSLDLNLENSHGEDLKWSRMLLSALFQNRKTTSPPKFVKPNRMLKYQQYTKFKVQHTIAQYLQTIKTYEMHSIDYIITNYLNIPSLDLKDINMPGLFLVPPQQNELNKIKYDFTLQDISKKPIRQIFKTFKSVSVEVQTDCKQFQEKEMQTFPMTNLITKVTQTQKIYNYTSINTQTDQIQKEIHQPKPPIFFTQKEQQEPIKLKYIVQKRKSSFFPRNSALLFKNDIDTNNTSLNLKHNQSMKISQKNIQSPFVSPRKNSLTNEYKLQQIDEDIFQSDLSDLKKRKFKQSALNPSTAIATKLRNTLTKITRVSTIVKPSRKTSLLPTPMKSLNQTDKVTPNISGMNDTLRSGDDQSISKVNRKQSQRDKQKQDLFGIKFINSEAILQLGQLQSGESSIDAEDQYLDIESHLKKLSKKPIKASSQILKRDPFCTQLKDQIFDYEIQNTNKIWQTVLKAAKAESFTIKNVSHKVLHLTRQFISIFSDIVKSKVFGNKFISESLNKKYCSSNLHPKYIFKPLQSLRSIITSKVISECKKKQDIQKSLKLLIGQLLVLSQTKQMQIFVNLMGLGTQSCDSTELEILVRMMYFFNPSKPYGFSPDIIINFNLLKTHFPLIVDNILSEEIISNILKQFSQPTTIIMLSQVFRSVCKQIDQLKKQFSPKYKYISKYFPYPTFDNFKLLFQINPNFIKLKNPIQKKMIHFSDCYDKNHDKCLSEQKLWRLGISCNLPSQQQYLSQLNKIKIPKIHIYLFTKYCNQIKQKDTRNKSQTSINKLINQLEKQNTSQEQKQHLHCLLYSVILNQLVDGYIGSDLEVLNQVLTSI